MLPFKQSHPKYTKKIIPFCVYDVCRVYSSLIKGMSDIPDIVVDDVVKDFLALWLNFGINECNGFHHKACLANTNLPSTNANRHTIHMLNIIVTAATVAVVTKIMQI